MNPYIDQQSCLNCKMCYRRNTPWCNDNCRRCSIAMFSENEVNVYPWSSNIDGGSGTYPYPPNYPFAFPDHSPVPKSFGRLYYNYPRVSNQYYPAMFPFANYYGSLYKPNSALTFW